MISRAAGLEQAVQGLVQGRNRRMAVEEGEVIARFERGQHLGEIALVDRDARRKARGLDMLAREPHMLGIAFDGVDFGLRRAMGKRERGVAERTAELEDAPCIHRRGERAEQRAVAIRPGAAAVLGAVLEGCVPHPAERIGVVLWAFQTPYPHTAARGGYSSVVSSEPRLASLKSRMASPPTPSTPLFAAPVRHLIGVVVAVAGGLLGLYGGEALAYAIAEWTDRDIAELKDMLIWSSVACGVVGLVAGVWLVLACTRCSVEAQRTALIAVGVAVVCGALLMLATFDWPKSAGTPNVLYEIRLPAGTPQPRFDRVGVKLWNEKSGSGCYISGLRRDGDRPVIAGSCPGHEQCRRPDHVARPRPRTGKPLEDADPRRRQARKGVRAVAAHRIRVRRRARTHRRCRRANTKCATG